jgi:hypothetical protein
MKTSHSARQEGARPNLFIVGAPKCGTTAWPAYLRTHPEIFFSEVKEPNFFAPDMSGIHWVSDLAAYERLFRRGRTAKVRGEASAIYLYSTEAADAIKAYNPDARILIFLRDQTDFLPSWHHHLLFRFAEDIENFEEAWRLSGKRANVPQTCLEPKLLDYAAVADFRAQVERYLAAFPREQILVIPFREWTSDPRATYLRILDFLGLEDDGRSEFPRVNEAKSYRIKWIGKLIARPPRLAAAAVAMLRKILGRDALGLAIKASELISAPGYTTSVSASLRTEIRRRYEQDNRLLNERLGIAMSAW